MSVETTERPADAVEVRRIADEIESRYLEHEVTSDARWAAVYRLRALATVLDKITPLNVHLLNRYMEMACTCGVVTEDDRRDWDAAVNRLPDLLEALSALAPA